MSTRSIRVAALYLLVGVALGMAKGIRRQFTLAPVHAHVNLLGWVSPVNVGATVVFPSVVVLVANVWRALQPAAGAAAAAEGAAVGGARARAAAANVAAR